ncbi:TPA: hypothetical protein PWK54_005120 [Escherichia coli]|nr:hypothetical protein [Escherichia coli]HCS5607271.1 hypothetical protein [Escherichia coli]HCW2811388.1 hypothetical protein [Escherichia coli]HDL0260858.1 hypothetical protein [Escherichia coli]HDL0323070.1 hypothetical protein [Escherichia coli]
MKNKNYLIAQEKEGKVKRSPPQRGVSTKWIIHLSLRK